MTLLRSRSAIAAATAALALAVTACSSGSSGSAAASSSPTAAAEASAAPVSGEPFGDGCSAVPAEGEGSLQGMTDDPVATAASHEPALSTLVEALTAADLVDALNSAPDITVLAPGNQAFEAVPAETLQALLADNAQLSAVLTHHVLEGRLTPDQLAGEHSTLAGDTVTVQGSGQHFTIAADQTVTGAADATVICGNVQTANATVYVIDQVLSPPPA